MQEAEQDAEDGGGQEQQADEDQARHLQQPQALERRERDKGHGRDLQRHEHQQPDGRGEDAARPGLAISQVAEREPVEVIEAVAHGVVAEIAVVLTMQPKVPLP